MPRKIKNPQETHSMHELRMKKRIKSAAFELIAQKGIGQVSMREIAEKVKVTKPVLYYYFKDKEDLCSSIIAEHEEQFAHFLQGALSEDLSASDLLGKIFERHLDFFQKDASNSKFITQIITHALNTKLQKFKKRTQENTLAEAFACLARKGGLVKKGQKDLECLVRAVFLQIMFSAYVSQYDPALIPYAYDKSSVNRLAKILILGINAYYKPQK